jgi:tetratricopeptide (TPR) repeat protein
MAQPWLAARAASLAAEGLAHNATTTRAPSGLRRGPGCAQRGRLLDHDKHVSERRQHTGRRHGVDRDRHRAAFGGAVAAGDGNVGRALPGEAGGSGRGGSLAAAVLEQSAIRNPDNRVVLGAYGRALADNGNYQQALDVLNRAHTQDQPDWRILSVQGAVLDQMGRHADAQRHYASALRLMPDEPSVLSNLGLSYALSKNLPQAEATLRRAAAQRGAEPKVRQNLALVVGLQGRFQEAETIARGDLSPDEAAANVAYLRQMLAQQSDWKKGKRSSPLVPTAGS